MQTHTNNTTIQSLPDGFALTLRNHILDAGEPARDAWPFDPDARQLGTLIATARHPVMLDLRRNLVLIAERDFMIAVSALSPTQQTFKNSLPF